MTDNLHLDQLGQVSLPILDQERAVAFYRDILGMKFLYEYPNLAFFDLQGVRLLLSVVADAATPPKGSILYFKVDEIYAATQMLKDKGIEFTEDPHRIAVMDNHDLWMSFFEDTEGNMLALMSEVLHED